MEDELWSRRPGLLRGDLDPVVPDQMISVLNVVVKDIGKFKNWWK